MRAGDCGAGAPVPAQSRLLGLVGSGPEATAQGQAWGQGTGLESALSRAFLGWLFRKPWNAAPGAWHKDRGWAHTAAPFPEVLPSL